MIEDEPPGTDVLASRVTDEFADIVTVVPGVTTIVGGEAPEQLRLGPPQVKVTAGPPSISPPAIVDMFL